MNVVSIGSGQSVLSTISEIFLGPKHIIQLCTMYSVSIIKAIGCPYDAFLDTTGH